MIQYWNITVTDLPPSESFLGLSSAAGSGSVSSGSITDGSASSCARMNEESSVATTPLLLCIGVVATEDSSFILAQDEAEPSVV